MPPMPDAEFQANDAPATPPAFEPHETRLPDGRVRIDGLDENTRNYTMAIHLSLLSTVAIGIGFLAPIVMWLIRRDESAFIDDHGRELTNVVITGAIVTMLMFIPIIGWIAMPVWYIVTVVGIVRGAMAAKRGEYFRYPMIIRFV